MLQQTQVERVVPFYKKFLKSFPTAALLASASLSSVLRLWQGLGYNRRAKYLHEAAKQIVARHEGKVPCAYEDLRALPGVGEYTSRAVRTFAWNEPEIFLETNIRTVFLHHWFPGKKNVSDTALVSYMELALDRKNPRQWYWALMDYGAHLKKMEGNASIRSTHYVRQKPFKGSDREIRGAILRALSESPHSLKELVLLPFQKSRIKTQIAALLKEGFLALRVTRYALRD